MRTTFGASSAIELALVSGHLAEQGDTPSMPTPALLLSDLMPVVRMRWRRLPG